MDRLLNRMQDFTLRKCNSILRNDINVLVQILRYVLQDISTFSVSCRGDWFTSVKQKTAGTIITMGIIQITMPSSETKMAVGWDWEQVLYTVMATEVTRGKGQRIMKGM